MQILMRKAYCSIFSVSQSGDTSFISNTSHCNVLVSWCFCENFVKSTSLKSFSFKWFHDIFFKCDWTFHFCTQCEKTRNFLSFKNLVKSPYTYVLRVHWFGGIFARVNVPLHSVLKNEKFSLTKKIFREINSLVTSFVNPQ